MEWGLEKKKKKEKEKEKKTSKGQETSSPSSCFPVFPSISLLPSTIRGGTRGRELEFPIIKRKNKRKKRKKKKEK